MGILRRDRIVSQAGKKAARDKTETRSGMVWAIYPTTRTCQVTIQGSSEKLIARFPSQNWEIPHWLKVEGAVTIQHTRGDQSSLLIVGPGDYLPTPEIGASGTPPRGTGANCILTGCEVFVHSGMQVFIKKGTFRINDVIYSTGEWTLSEGSQVLLEEGSQMLLGEIADVVPLSAADSTRFRFDLICIGADKQIDYVVGTPDATNPEKPAIPAGHIKIRYIMVPPATIELSQENIGQSFVPPVASSLQVSNSSLELEWEDTYVEITLIVVDQYERPISGNWSIQSTLISGTGSVTSPYVNGGSTMVAKYTRQLPQGSGEESPVFIEFKLEQDTDIINQTVVVLTDELGVPIFG